MSTPSPTRRSRRPVIVFAVLFAALLALTGWGISVRARLSAAPPAVEVDYVGSAACEGCHADRHASWARTFHRTMTQDATAQTVTGRFDGALLDAFGGAVRPGSDGTRWWFDYADPQTGQALGQVEVKRLVGSHRYQQYLTKAPDSETYYRLHYLWHIADQRWVHMNAAFLGSDAQDFDAQVTVWNGNCVNCHNTGAQPRLSNMADLKRRAAAGERVDIKREMRFDTKVAELGISCETCHGPGAEHSARMHETGTRWWTRLAGFTDLSIVEPSRLDAARNNAICGACHAGRTPKDASDIEAIYDRGIRFRPGDLLEDHLKPLARDTPSPSVHDPGMFAQRFWTDGTPRLTAYEYQGTRDSPCSQSGRYTCVRCHTMHSGNPASMLPDDGRGNDSCLSCHRPLRGQESAHSGHASGSPGNNCQSCHMPRAVYGVMEIHRTHHIAVPDPVADHATGKPNACLNCHQEQNLAWALAASQKLWPERAFTTRVDTPAAEQPPPEFADGLSGLLAGDPVRQAIAAYELGQIDQASGPAALLPRLPWLIEALEDDRPAVRRFSQRSLLAVSAALAEQGRHTGFEALLTQFDFTGTPHARGTVVKALRQRFAALNKSTWPAPGPQTGLDAAYQLDPAVRARLLSIGAADNRQIDVGE